MAEKGSPPGTCVRRTQFARSGVMVQRLEQPGIRRLVLVAKAQQAARQACGVEPSRTGSRKGAHAYMPTLPAADGKRSSRDHYGRQVSGSRQFVPLGLGVRPARSSHSNRAGSNRLYALRPWSRSMNPDTVFITLLTCAYLCIAVLGLRTVLRDARTRRVRERLIADRYRPGRGDL